MYTGTLIQDLMAAVERAERRAEQQRLADERELHAIFAMQIPALQIPTMQISAMQIPVETDGVFQGAA